MKSLKKRAKARKQHKSYEKKRNIARNVKKSKRTGLKPGDGILPGSKKYRLSKKTKAIQKRARRNIIKTATGN